DQLWCLCPDALCKLFGFLPAHLFVPFQLHTSFHTSIIRNALNMQQVTAFCGHCDLARALTSHSPAHHVADFIGQSCDRFSIKRAFIPYIYQTIELPISTVTFFS